jgi:hypothetical protein
MTIGIINSTGSLKVTGDYQPADAGLTAIAALSDADSNVIVGSAGGWVAESGATARTSLGLGTGDSPQFTAVAVATATVTGAHGQTSARTLAMVQSGAMSGATLTLTNLIPAGSVVFSVTVHPTTAIASGDGGTTYSVGDGTDVDRWGAAIAFAADVTLANATITSIPIYAATTSVVLTCDGGKTFNAGVVRVTVHYLTATAATS